MTKSKILIPVCETTASLNSLQYAREFAQSLDAELYILHVTEELSDVDQQFLSPLDENKNPNEYLIVRKGIKNDEIIKAADEITPDTIIMSTIGFNPEDKFFMSKDTTLLIKESVFPILAIPPDVSFREISSAVLLCNVENVRMEWIRKLIYLFNKPSIQISLLFFSEKDQLWLQKSDIERLVHEYKNNTGHVKINAELYESSPNSLIALEMFLKENRIDLFCLDVNEKLFNDIAGQSPEEKMPCLIDTPIMAFHGHSVTTLKGR